MGDFIGHLVPGVAWICLALWWIHNMTRDYHRTVKAGIPFRSRCSYDATIRSRRVPVEIIPKIGYVFCGIFLLILKHGSKARVFTFVNETGQFTHIDRLQHASLISTFLLHWIIDLLNYCRVSPITNKLQYLTLSFAYFWFFFLFVFHTLDSTNKSPLELVLHRMFLGITLITSLTVIWEMRERNNVIPQFIRCWFSLIIGTWFIQIAWILYSHKIRRAPNPVWDTHDPHNVATIVPIFGFHLVSGFTTIFLWYTTVALTPLLVARWKRGDNYCGKTRKHVTDEKISYEAVQLICDEDKETIGV